MEHSDHKTTGDDEVEACPNCDSTAIRPNVGNTVRGRDGGESEFTCSNCSERFDEPEVREKRHSGGPKRGAAARLYAADPSELEDE